MEPRSSPVEPIRRSATLGRIALKRVAVSVPMTAVIAPPAGQVGSELPAMPEWMRAPSETPVATPGEPAVVSAKLVALLARVENGSQPTGPVLASLIRLLIQRRVVDEAAVAAAFEKL